MKCSAIPPGHISAMFTSIVIYVERAVERANGRLGIDDVFRMLYSGESNLWVAFDETDSNRVYGIVITTVKTYPCKRMVDMTFCAGDRLEDWQDEMMELVDRWAIDSGLDGMEFTGRKGWGKVLAKHGLTESYRLFEKDY